MSVTTISLTTLGATDLLSINYPIAGFAVVSRKASWEAAVAGKTWSQMTLVEKVMKAAIGCGEHLVTLVNGNNSAGTDGPTPTRTAFYDPIARLWFTFADGGVHQSGIAPSAMSSSDTYTRWYDLASQKALSLAMNVIQTRFSLGINDDAFAKFLEQGRVPVGITKTETRIEKVQNNRSACIAGVVAGVAGYALGFSSGREDALVGAGLKLK